MASIPASAVLAAEEAQQAALTAADNALFIADADQQIQAAIALGLKREVSMTTFGHVNPRDIYMYYANLGYNISYPDLQQGQAFQPADLFGNFWINYLNHTLLRPWTHKPLRVVINWAPFIQFYDFPDNNQETNGDEPV